ADNKERRCNAGRRSSQAAHKSARPVTEANPATRSAGAPFNHCSLPHPIDFERPYAVDLYNGIFVYGKMVHAFGHDHVRSCWHVLASCFIVLVTDAHTENSREHREAFVSRMEVWRNRARRAGS